MRLHSADFADGSRLDARFTCEGEDAAPRLSWSDLPPDTAVVAITCEDPDAPGGTFVHWVSWGWDPATGSTQDAKPTGQGRNDFGEVGYRGPCPPPGHGDHRYIFTAYAVSERLELYEGAGIDDLRAAIEGKTLATATITGTYSR